MAENTALVGTSPVTIGWPPVAVAFALLMGLFGGGACHAEVGTNTTIAVDAAGLTLDGHVQVSRIGNARTSRYSHRRLFEQLRAFRAQGKPDQFPPRETASAAHGGRRYTCLSKY